MREEVPDSDLPLRRIVRQEAGDLVVERASPAREQEDARQ
jgi:hypothetical protein